MVSHSQNTEEVFCRTSSVSFLPRGGKTGRSVVARIKTGQFDPVHFLKWTQNPSPVHFKEELTGQPVFDELMGQNGLTRQNNNNNLKK